MVDLIRCCVLRRRGPRGSPCWSPCGSPLAKVALFEGRPVPVARPSRRNLNSAATLTENATWRPVFAQVGPDAVKGMRLMDRPKFTPPDGGAYAFACARCGAHHRVTKATFAARYARASNAGASSIDLT